MTDAGVERRSVMPVIPALDGVRALAVVAVLLYHADVSWMPGGFLGVDVFFVLSGYLITSLLWGELGDGGRIDVRRFWVRRARRLFPALFLMIAAVTTSMLVGWNGEVARVRGDIAAAAGYVSNWHELFAGRSYFNSFGRPSPFGHLWSLAIEEQFYLLWPVVLALLFIALRRARRVAAVVAAAAAGSVAGAWLLYRVDDPSRVYFGTDTRASALLVGATLALVWRPWALRLRFTVPRRLSTHVAIISCAALGWAFTRFAEFSAFTFRPGLVIVACAAAMLIWALVQPSSTAARAFGWRPLRALGQRSYGIYLWHWPVFVFTRPDVDLPFGGVPAFALRIALTLAVAELSFRFVEQPIRNGALGRIASSMRELLAVSRRLGFAWVSAAAMLTCLALGTMTLAVVRAPTLVSDVEASFAQAPTTDVGLEPATPPARDPSLRTGVIALGDSVMLGAKPQLHATLRRVYVDAALSRQVGDGVRTLGSLRARRVMREVVVVHLGTNGRFQAKQFDAIMRVAGPSAKVVWVTLKVPRRWETVNNRVIAAGVKRYPDRAVLVDWHRTWRTCRGRVFWSDGTHLTKRGALCYARLIANAI